MRWLAFSPWQILLSLVTPALVGLLICLAEMRGPFAQPLHKTTGIVAPYFTGIALLFALVTAQLLAEVWQKDNAARASVQGEDDAIRALRVTVGFFTVAFTFCLVLIAVFDLPFEVALADEPGATLNHTIKSLPP